jgi:hypothetical protein
VKRLLSTEHFRVDPGLGLDEEIRAAGWLNDPRPPLGGRNPAGDFRGEIRFSATMPARAILTLGSSARHQGNTIPRDTSLPSATQLRVHAPDSSAPLPTLIFDDCVVRSSLHHIDHQQL